MAEEDPVRAAIDRLLLTRLEQLRRASGLPVVFAGTVEDTRSGRRLVLGRLLGTVGSSLEGLVVNPGRGLGGTVLALGIPRRINDYASSTSITHDYDQIVVDQEQITSIFALPVRASGVMRAVLYGAARDGRPIGDAALHRAGAFVARLERDVDVVLSRRLHQDPNCSPSMELPPRARAALDDLAALARVVTDPALQEQLRRIHRDLDGRPTRVLSPSQATELAPRELDVLRLVAVGASNADIAERLGLSIDTVKTYLRNAMRRLEVSNRTGAVHAARSAGLL